MPPTAPPPSPNDGLRNDAVTSAFAFAAPSPMAAVVQRRLLDAQRLWVDPFTADLLAQAAAGDAAGDAAGELRVIAACARTGRSAFRAIPVAALRA